MRYRVHSPAAPLSRFVAHLWSLSDAPAHARERILPNGTLELVINLVADEFRISAAPGSSTLRGLPGAIVSGCYGAPFEFDTRAHASIMGVHFRPGGAVGLLGVAPGELADTHVALDALWGLRAASELRERLCTAASARDRFVILERALLARLARGREPRSAVQRALPMLQRPDVDVGGITRELQLSRRRFIEVFSEDVGMTPKRFARVRRFQRALAMATADAAPPWSELALACGYFDQAHLCREWAELSGVSPSDLIDLRRSPVKEHHVAVAEGGSNRSKTARSPAHR